MGGRKEEGKERGVEGEEGAGKKRKWERGKGRGSCRPDAENLAHYITRPL